MTSIARAMTLALGLAVLSASVASAQESPLIEGPVRRFTAAPGFQVVIAHAEAAEGVEPRAIIGLYTRNGRTTESIPGYAHMSEHLFANSRSPIRDSTIPEGTEFLDSNAQARPDYVSAWITVNRPDGSDAAPVALALRYSARIWDVDLNETVFEEQRARVVAELTRGLPSGTFLSERALEHAFYGRLPELEEEIALTQGYDYAHMLAYSRAIYQPEEMVLVIAGDIDVEAMESALRDHFAARGEVVRKVTPDLETLLRPAQLAPYDGPVMRRSDVVEGDWVAAGIPAPPRESSDYLAFLVLDQWLLGGREDFTTLWSIRRSINSPLGEALAASGPLDYLGDARGYGAASPPLAEGDPAYFTIQFGANEMDVEAAIQRFESAIAAIRQAPPSDEELLAARAQTIEFYRRWLNYDNLRPLSDHLAGMALNDPAGPERVMELHDKLASVTPEDVRRVIDTYLTPGSFRYGTMSGAIVPPDTESQ